MQRGVKLASSLVLTCQSVNWDNSQVKFAPQCLLRPIKVGDKLLNLPIIALIAYVSSENVIEISVKF